MNQNATLLPTDMEEHPLVEDVNALHRQQLSPIEKTCKRIADATGAPIALILAIILQFAWIGFGVATRFDPFPFVFLLTCSNVLQLILIFVIAVAQRQSSQHDELRAEADHDAISRILYHQQLQETFLLALSEKLGVDTTALRQSVAALAT
ncbi:MAG: DUF1003 domain-containing protein [Candidatus Eremiobacteraeota bacterium]|nr:DUF1003 domain-containing protein [Candidatus Eremiobacteraeota bacterium]